MDSVIIKRLSLVFICFLFLHILALSSFLGFDAGVLSAVGAILPLFFWLPFVLKLDPFEEEPIPLLVFSFVFGAVSAYLMAFAGNLGVAHLVNHLLYKDLLMTVLLAPFVEELCKFSIVIMVFVLAKKEFDNVIDGIIYGVFIGFGFAFSENMLYYSRIYSQHGFSEMLDTVVMRGFATAFLHPLFTGLLGAAIFMTTKFKNIIFKICLLLFSFMIVVCMHGFWNLTSGLTSWAMYGVYFGVYVPTTFCIIAISVYYNQKTKEMMKKYLHEFSDKELVCLTSVIKRTCVLISILFKHGYKSFLAGKKYHKAAYLLARMRYECENNECDTVERLQQYCANQYNMCTIERFLSKNGKNFFVGETK